MPTLVRFYIIHCVIGFSVAALFTAGIFWFNVANLWHLVSTSDIGVLAIIVFWVLNGIVFAGVQFAVAIMLLAESDDENDTPHRGSTVPVLVPIKVCAEFIKPRLR
jgi:dolichyl-phosphate-mannose--protein O-mannosyl transferase